MINRQCLCHRRRGFLSGFCHRTRALWHFRSHYWYTIANWVYLFLSINCQFDGSVSVVCALQQPSCASYSLLWCIYWRNLPVVKRTRPFSMSQPSNMLIILMKSHPMRTLTQEKANLTITGFLKRTSHLIIWYDIQYIDIIFS